MNYRCKHHQKQTSKWSSMAEWFFTFKMYNFKFDLEFWSKKSLELVLKYIDLYVR